MINWFSLNELAIYAAFSAYFVNFIRGLTSVQVL